MTFLDFGWAARQWGPGLKVQLAMFKVRVVTASALGRRGSMVVTESCAHQTFHALGGAGEVQEERFLVQSAENDDSQNRYAMLSELGIKRQGLIFPTLFLWLYGG